MILLSLGTTLGSNITLLRLSVARPVRPLSMARCNLPSTTLLEMVVEECPGIAVHDTVLRGGPLENRAGLSCVTSLRECVEVLLKYRTVLVT